MTMSMHSLPGRTGPFGLRHRGIHRIDVEHRDFYLKAQACWGCMSIEKILWAGTNRELHACKGKWVRPIPGIQLTAVTRLQAMKIASGFRCSQRLTVWTSAALRIFRISSVERKSILARTQTLRSVFGLYEEASLFSTGADFTLTRIRWFGG